MAKENIFDKEWVDERDKNNLEGLLEQLNLPPAVVKFVREHKRAVQIVIGVLIAAVVVWSLYGSYRDNRIEKSTEALAAALELEGQQMIDQLNEVERSYPGTDAALWARINTAQELSKTGRMEDANRTYKDVRDEISASSILQPLVMVGIAQTAEASGNFDESSGEYQKLMEIQGYEDIGFLGLGRIHELEGETAKALEVYERYLTEIDTAPVLQKRLVEEKIASIKAAQ
jgi:predicted negative regulator of RcsB-dependent stress response